MTKPLVSVIVPVHDGEPYLREALESVMAQDHQPVELVVVDDGSTDRSGDIARSFPQATVLIQENRGPSAARNAGIAASSGQLVAFLDADDVMLPHKLSAQAAFLAEHPEVGCVLARQTIHVEEGVEVPGWVTGDRLEEDTIPTPAAAMIRRRHIEEVGGFDETLTHAEDQDLLFRLREAGVRIGAVPDVLLIRRIHGANLTYQDDVARASLLRSIKGRLDSRRDRSR